MVEDRGEYSVLIIGCGNIAGGYDKEDIAGPDILTHAKAFNAHPGFDLVGCVDMSPGIARDFADTWQVDRAYDSLDQALTDRDFDIISICSVTSSHEAYLRQVLTSEAKLIFCEKPITDSLVTAREMAALYNARMVVNYLRRFDPGIRQLASEIDRGVYGTFVSGKATYNKGLFNNGSHMTDLLNMLVGPVHAVAGMGVIYDFWPDDPTLSAGLETAQKTPVEMIGSDVRQGMVFDLNLIFDGARITLTEFGHSLTICLNDGPEKKTSTDLNRGMLNAVTNIHDHLTTGAALYSTADNGLAALEVCEEIRRLAGL